MYLVCTRYESVKKRFSFLLKEKIGFLELAGTSDLDDRTVCNGFEGKKTPMELGEK